MKKHITLLSGSAHPEFAKSVSKHVGVDLTPVEVKRFNDGETYIRVTRSVRGCHVFIIQPTCPPVNDNLMELLIIADTLKRASAREITAVIPYFGYGRQDRKVISREPITAKLVADLIETSGIDRVVTFDLHADQIQGFFNIPVDNLAAMPILAKYITDKKLKDIVVVSPDAGGTTRARRFAKALYADLAIIDKRRPAHGESKVMHLMGEVKGKTAILTDDLIDTGGTIANAASELVKRGAKAVYVCATHGLFSNDAMKKLDMKDIEEIIICDTIPIKSEKIPKIHVTSLATFTAELIESIFEGEQMGVIVEGKHKQIKK